MGHEVSNVSNIKNRISKRPLPMFYINLKPKPNNKDIYKCSAILHTKISFEPDANAMVTLKATATIIPDVLNALKII